MLLGVAPEDVYVVVSFNGHPPLGVNATIEFPPRKELVASLLFQWAPTLGGECYNRVPATQGTGRVATVSMGTHPWG